MDLGKKIRMLRTEANINQTELGKYLGVGKTTISNYETGYSMPDIEITLKIAEYFNVTVDDLLKPRILKIIENPQKYLVNRISPVKSGNVPIFGTIRAGLPILADENIEGYLDVPDSMRADFVLRVQGDSMTGAGILDGDLVICKTAEAAQSGQIVVALQDQSAGFSDATLKYYYDANGHGAVLRPANPNYSEINMSDGYRISGVMVALVREDAPGYQTYKNYIAVPDHEEWTEVIELANQAGLKVGQVKEILAGQVAIAKKIRG
jgi:repressor LexA